ncbi:hypothetical protein Patl1_26323 [Pistacia atlantica]|uniref:Uncharacterized protein n=1 Tax=Pistacia atlantica TaxID=434234 RepID=A0ACC1B112_9ROSI|nr:hypothetical protein Patl1_26323 [Pistacia atlantica]
MVENTSKDLSCIFHHRT